MEQREGAAQVRSLTLDEFTAIVAELDAGLERHQVLAKAGLSDDAWEAAQGRWLAKLAADASQGKLKTSRRYIKLLETQKAAARAKAKPARKKPGATPPAEPRVPPPPNAAAAPPPNADPSTITVTAGFEPILRELMPFRSPPPQQPSAEPRPARASHQSSPDLSALPFQSAPQAAAPHGSTSISSPAPIPSPAQPPIPARAQTTSPTQAPIPSPARTPIPAPSPDPTAATIDLTATLTGPLGPLLREAIPFQPQDPPPGSETPKTARPTQDPSKHRSALPFQSPPQPAQPRPASPAPPLKPPMAAPTAPPPAIDLSATMNVPADIAAALAAQASAAPREAMPFRSPTPPPEAPPARRRSRDSSTDLRALPFQAASPSAPPQRLTPPPTPPAPPMRPTPPPAPPMPPVVGATSPPAPPTAPPALSEADRRRIDAVTLNEYAQICAAVRRFPDDIARLRAQLNFNETSWKALHAVWQERFAQSPELRERWKNLIQIKMRQQ